MNTVSVTAIIDFEVYLLMTMKRRMSMLDREAQLNEKLSVNGLSVDYAERVHERIAETLDDETSRFENMKKLLGPADQGTTSLKYSSALWPGFDFHAIAGEDGLLESARYSHTGRDRYEIDSPTELPTWSMDVTEFMETFGPMTGGRQWPLFDPLLPAYEEYEFPWNGERHGAGFAWGLFLYSSKYWPED